MSANWRKNGNWPNRLKDWEQQGSGPLPGEDLWSRIEANLPPPKKKRILPVWWLLLFGGLLGITLTLWPKERAEALTQNGNDPAETQEAQVTRASLNPVDQRDPLVVEVDELSDSESDALPGKSLGEAKLISTGVEAAGTATGGVEASSLEGGARLLLGEINTEGERDMAVSVDLAPAPRGPEVISLEQPTSIVPTAAPVLEEVGEDDLPENANTDQILAASSSPKEVAFLPFADMEKLSTGLPELSLQTVPTKKFSPVSASVPLRVHLNAGIIRMRTEVKTPVGVELSPVDRGERFETGNGSFLAVGVQKGRFGFSAGYREQPQSNEYFTRRQLNFDRSQEEDSPDGLRTSTYELEAKDGFSNSTLEIEVKRSSNSQVNERDILRVEVRTDQDLDVRTLPLLATYEQPIGRLFALRVGAGFSYNELRLSQSRTLTRVQLGNGLILNQNRLLRGQRITRKFDYWALHTQAGIFLAPRNFPLSIGVGMDLSRSIGNWWPQRPDGRWLETRGLNVMAGIRF